MKNISNHSNNTNGAAPAEQKRSGIQQVQNDSDPENKDLMHQKNGLEKNQADLEDENKKLRSAFEKAEQTAQKYAELYDLGPIACFTLSREGTIIEVNQTGTELLCKTKSEIVNENIKRFLHRDSELVFISFLKNSFESRTRQNCEVVLSPSQNSEIHLSLTSAFSASGNTVLVSAFDISERRKVEAELRRREIHDKNFILQTAMDGFWRVNLKGEIIEVNNRYCEMSGYTEHELLGMHISDFDVRENKSLVFSRIQKVLQSGKDRFESEHRRKDGSTFYVEININLHPGEEKNFLVFLHDISNRKRIEKKIRESEKRYRTLFNDNHSVLLLIDSNSGDIVDVNPAATSFYGWSKQEMCRKNISEINMLPQPEIQEKMRSSKNKNENHFIFKHRLADKSIRDVEVYTGPIVIDNNELIFSIVHDVTDRIKIEKALHESELKFQKYIDFAPHGVFVTNEFGEYIEVNSSACKITGYSKDELLTMKIADLVPQESMKDAFVHFSNIKKNGFASGEFPLIKKDKSTAYWSVDAVKLSDKFFLGFVVDITNRKKAEELLMENEQRYRSLFENSNDAIFLVDVKTRYYIDCNRVAEKLTGYTRDEILSLKAGAFLPPQHKRNVSPYLEKIVSDKVLREETEIISKSGTMIPVEFTSSTVEINNRQCIFSMLHDISDRKEIEKALKQSEESVRLKLQSILSPDGSLADLELKDILDIPSTQKLMDSFNQIVKVSVAIIDTKGKILSGAGWQEICTRFHRINMETCRNCLESDVLLTRDIPEGEFKMYRCKNNMWDIATPLIIGGEHKGNLFMGQFLFEHENIDVELFKRQAKRFNFDEEDYLEALKKVPRLDKKLLDHTKEFFLNLAQTISQLNYSNVKLARAIEQQKITETALREQKELLNKAQKIANLGSWSLDLMNNTLTWSDEVYRIFGWSKKRTNISYKDFMEAVHPDDREMVNTRYTQSVINNRKGYKIEHRIITKNSKEIRYVFEKCEHERDSEGKIIRSVGMILDITERKKREEELRENERILRESQSVGKIGSYSVDIQNRTWKATREVYRIFGITKDASNSLELWIKSIHPNFKERLVHELFEEKSGEKTFEHEYKIIRENDQVVRWVQGIGKFEYDKQNRKRRLIGTIQDITTRKNAEESIRHLNEKLEERVNERTAELKSTNEELRLEIKRRREKEQELLKAEEKYKTIADYNYAWETWRNTSGEFIYVSPSCEKITGYRVSDFMNDASLFYQIAHPDDQAVVKTHFYDALALRLSDISFDFRIITKSGEERWISHFTRAVYNQEGNWIGLRGSNSDITARKNTENSLRESQNKLRALTQHINALAEEERKNIAREIHDELGHMLTALKYDIDNLLEDSSLSMAEIKTELPTLNSMVESLIDSVRRIATELRPGILDHLGLFPAIEWQINQFRMMTKMKCSCHIEEMNFAFDKEETTTIFRILQEILTNIARHSKAKNVDITIRKQAHQFVMKVSDDGVGFDVSKSLGDSSLGLIGMQERALSIGGEIDLESIPDKGTSVSFLIEK